MADGLFRASERISLPYSCDKSSDTQPLNRPLALLVMAASADTNGNALGP